MYRLPLPAISTHRPAQPNAVQRPPGVFRGGGAARLDGGLAAAFFLLVDFGFFASRLLRF